LRNWNVLSHKSIWYPDESHLTINERRAYVRKKDSESWNELRFWKKKKAHPTGIHVWMMIDCKGVQQVKWTYEQTYINGEYYQENIIKPFILTKTDLKTAAKN
jgi:hypothetical protein